MTVKHQIKSASGKLQEVTLTRGKAIRYFCYECMGWQKQEGSQLHRSKLPVIPFQTAAERLRNAAKRGLIRARLKDQASGVP